MPEKPTNDIDDLRSHLFDTLRSLKGEVKQVELERAKAVCEVAGKIIDTAKVEVSFLKVTQNTSGTGFFSNSPKLPALADPDQQPTRPALPATTGTGTLKNGKDQERSAVARHSA